MSLYTSYIIPRSVSNLLPNCNLKFENPSSSSSSSYELLGDYCQFKIVLSKDINIAWELLKRTVILTVDHKCDLPQNELVFVDRISASLITCLGLPYDRTKKFHDELGFIKSIYHDPCNLLNWTVYADFMRDKDDPRGEMLADVMSNKSMQMNRNFNIPVRTKDRFVNADQSLIKEILESI